MEKKDIYEHLAKIYLDTPVHKKKSAENSEDYKLFVFIGIAVVFIFSLFFLIPFSKQKPLNAKTALVLSPDPIKIAYRFDPAKKEIYTFDLMKLNLNGYRTLDFSVKKSNFKDLVSIRIEMINAYNEKSEVYIKDVSHRWKDSSVSLAEFSEITQWSEMTSLSFIIEEWNTKENTGSVFIDNVKFSK